MNYLELTRRLRALGCEETPRRGGGSHRRWFNPTTGLSAPVPEWGYKDIKPGTVQAIVRQLGLSRDEFGQIK
jgi:predicted RNA binding protein YcfA (HicA-like mRNA interferase family)